MKRLITYLFTLLFGSVGAQDLSLFKANQYQNDQGQVLPYRILFPKDYNKSQKYPLVLFLHGAGERGNDNESQLMHGVKTFLEGENRDNFPCIVLAPQCAKESYWSSVNVDRSQYPVTLDFDYKRDATHPLAMTIELLKKLTKEEAVDPDRVYITGLSMGGMGTMEALYRHPELFAAAASICGGGQAEAFDKRYGSIPLWLFHGDVDGVVKVEQSRELFTHFQANGLDVRYTEYPGVNHNSWENAYAEKDLLPWLFSHSRKKDDLPVVVGKNKAIVATTYGKVRGSIHRNIYTYKGIPYAKARRFQAPQQPDPWQGIRSSMSYGPVCPLLRPTTQVDDAGEFAFHHDWGYPNEDCLRLNIWTPGINDDKKRPVMLWFHGGGYTAGSSQELPSYDGESISRKGDVVLVSINHRLNVLGYLDLSAYGEEYQSSGNAGMMDLQASLEWIRDNIAAFGGDPNNVTIFGQSGGGGKVTTLMNAPSCKGLFHKAIVQSGVGVRFQDPAMSRRVGKAVVEALGIDPTQMTQIEEVPMDRLAEVAQQALGKVRDELEAEGKDFGVLGLGWGPVLDGHFLPFQTNTPQADALSADVPLMIGSTKNEFITSLWREPALKDADLPAVQKHLEELYGDQTADFVDAVKQAYPKDAKANDLADVDILFRKGTVDQANQKASTGKAPVYMYLFTWQSPANEGYYKALHCMELAFVFNNIHRCEEMTGGGYDAYVLADKMSQAWINFARQGNPNHDGLPNWEPYSPDKGACLLFDNVCELKFHHDRKLLQIAGSADFNQW